jgi:hypothetical protein
MLVFPKWQHSFSKEIMLGPERNRIPEGTTVRTSAAAEATRIGLQLRSE